MRKYRLQEGSIQHQFQQSRAKVQVFGGGYGNGKTTSLVIKTLQVARDYPGCNCLLARSTYPKLNDTLRKEFLAWCPSTWIKSFSKSDNILEMKNGSVVNFRYVSQKTGEGESSTSNLLSATYDFIGVDQMEDPEITEKDFNDLLGRLRGSTVYTGDDDTMPRSGPRWMVLTCNPTRNWFYRRIVHPLHDYQRSGVKPSDLLVDADTGEPIVELFEGSTYTNADNLPKDFIKTLESTYTGQMRDRFLLGQWAAYEGLVYSEYDALTHKVPHAQIERQARKLAMLGYELTPIMGYDYGIASPSCFIFGFADSDHNIFVADGFYEINKTIEWQADEIKRITKAWGVDYRNANILADPDIFRRKAGGAKTVGRSVADFFAECGIYMARGNNDILNGIQKVKAYLTPNMYHRNPITGTLPGSYIYFSDKLTWLENEIGDYYWKRDTDDEITDKPRDKNDHAMDALKYALSDVVQVAKFVRRPDDPPLYLQWGEWDGVEKQDRKPRYG